MPHRRRILNHIRSNLIAYIALFFALSGTAAYAAGGLLVYSDNIVDGQVFSVDVADDSLTGIDVQNGSLTGSDIADFTISSVDVTDENLGGWDIANGTLTGVDVADNSLTGDDIAENTLSLARMGCQSGKVLGFARVKGRALSRDFINGWTSNPKYIDITNNCAGGEVLVRSYEPGNYLVKFDGNPAALAVATNNDDVSCCDDDNILTVNKQYTDWDGWYFWVRIRDVCGQGNDSWDCRSSGVQAQSGDFTIVLP